MKSTQMSWKQRLNRLLGSRGMPGVRGCGWDPQPDALSVSGKSAGVRLEREAAGEPALLPIFTGDHVQGPESAAITLVEYGDYECPQCGEVYLVVEALKKILGERMRVIFRQYPYARLHPHAELAAEAAEAAAAQGKFWEMHEILFKNQDALTGNDLAEYAKSLQLDLPRFCWELTNQTYRKRVREVFRSGVRNGVYSTPSIFINGVRHDGPFDLETLCSAVTQQVCDGLSCLN